MADDADRDMRRLSLSPLAAPRDDSQPYFTPPAAENGPERNSDLQDLKTVRLGVLDLHSASGAWL